MAATEVKLEWSDGLIQSFDITDFYYRFGIISGQSGTVRIYFRDAAGNEGPASEFASWFAFVPGETFVIKNPALIDSSDRLAVGAIG